MNAQTASRVVASAKKYFEEVDMGRLPRMGCGRQEQPSPRKTAQPKGN